MQNICFEIEVELLQQKSSNAFESISKELNASADNANDWRKISDLKSLLDLRLCVDDQKFIHVDGRIENSELPVDSKHPLHLFGRHALTRCLGWTRRSTIRFDENLSQRF